MSAPAKINLTIYQGSTFEEVLRWESSKKVYKTISGITKSAPVSISATGHGVPTGWRVKITNVLGMKEINNTETYHTATAVDANTIEINAINAVGFADRTGGGIVEYNEPVDLTGYTARMQIRSRLEATDTILELTTENAGIVINNATKTITLVISAVASAALTFSEAVYSLELVSSGGKVTPFCSGKVTLKKEVTR
jgi:hypothetical protein